MNLWNFECDKNIKHNPVELFVIDLVHYDISVKTSRMEESGTTVPVFITLIGTNSKSPMKLLSERGFSQSSLVKSFVEAADVGNLVAIVLYLNGNDKWRPDEIIARKDNQDTIFKNTKNEVVTSLEGYLKLSIAIDDDNNNSGEKKNDANNQLLDSKDSEKIIQLTCNEVLKDNEKFGPVFVTANVNYMRFLAKCPADCLRTHTRAYGLGIHPEESPVCINAIVDRAMSFYGGIISVSIYRGLDSYSGGKKIFGIPVQGYGMSKRSYTIAKVDNSDIISMDVRILDSLGVPSFKGRVEIRNEGEWGTVCAFGLEKTAAQIICKQIGYNDGKFLNPPEESGKNFCANYEGINYCGVESAPVLFSHLICQGNEDNIMNCSRKMAEKPICTHEYDALVECGIVSDQQYVSFESNTLRLMESGNNPSQSGIGRLEILQGNWGSICNTKFSDKSASVACKQMGYIDGRLLGQADSNNMCVNVLGNNLCGDFSQSINLTEVECNGHESSIKYCRSSRKTQSCTHFNDVIVKCEGFGDSSGRSQNIKKAKVLNPLISKLPMQPTYNAKCDSTAKNINFRGDPGSIFLVNCPSECSLYKSSVTGTGVYSIDSSICRAALQSGVITNEGGNFALVKTYGQNKYYGSNVRGITSLESDFLNTSFFVTTINSAYTTMSSMINDMNFLELSSSVKDIERTSFLETKISTNNPSASLKAIYEWSSPTNEFSFGEKDVPFVDLYAIELAHKILELNTFTIYTKIIMRSFENKPQTILSVGGCDGYSITIDKNSELIFNVKCGNLPYHSLIYIPINSNVFISVVYDGYKVNFYLDGVQYNIESTYFHINYKSDIILGNSSDKSEPFNGKIFFLAVFDEPLSPARNEEIFKLGYTKPDIVNSPKYVTLDNRNCISSCALQAIPNTPGSPQPPEEAITYEVDGEKTVLSGPLAGYASKKIATSNMTPFTEVKCTTTAREVVKTDLKYGTRIRIQCPNDCNVQKGLIYGNLVYSLDSLLCFSGIHAGILRKNEEGMMQIKILPGLSYYQGVMQYGVQSTSIDNSDYSFIVEEAPKVIQIDCTTTSIQPQFAGTVGTRFLVNCPQDCSKISHNVFGNKIYSGDSSICQSAIHSGTLNNRGGEVHFVIEPGRHLYYQKKAFGINSKERDSYVKSISFYNSSANLFTKYEETFQNPTVTQNWDIIDNLDAINYPSKWEFVSTPPFIKTTSKFLLRQSRSIKSDSVWSYGSILSLKKTDVVNSTFKVSFFFINLSPVGIIFRYKDEYNYYHIRLNNGGNAKIALIKKFEGKSTLLASTPIMITPRVWYTFTVLVYYDRFQAYIQIGELRDNQLMFDTSDNDVQRGSLGIATNGNNDFYVNGIYIDNYDINKTNLSREMNDEIWSFHHILSENTKNGREKYCKFMFPKERNKELECQDYHSYCNYKCNDLIHKRENILNYNCKKECVKDSIMKEKVANLQTNEKLGHGLNSEVWSPQVEESCDYKPDNNGKSSYWVPCVITKIENNESDPEQKYVYLKYTEDAVEKRATVLYPNTTLKRCGTMVNRKDC